MGPPTPPGGLLQFPLHSPARMIFPKLKMLVSCSCLNHLKDLLLGLALNVIYKAQKVWVPPTAPGSFLHHSFTGASCNGFVSFLDRHHSVPIPNPKAFLHVLPSLVPVIYPYAPFWSQVRHNFFGGAIRDLSNKVQSPCYSHSYPPVLWHTSQLWFHIFLYVWLFHLCLSPSLDS